MSTRANWHLDIDVDQSDPFQNVQEVGEQLDLTADIAKVQARLADSVKIESTLYEEGVTCAIKDDPHATCSACSVRCRTPSEPLSALCSLGVEQERLMTQVAIARAGTNA